MREAGAVSAGGSKEAGEESESAEVNHDELKYFVQRWRFLYIWEWCICSPHYASAAEARGQFEWQSNGEFRLVRAVTNWRRVPGTGIYWNAGTRLKVLARKVKKHA